MNVTFTQRQTAYSQVRNTTAATTSLSTFILLYKYSVFLFSYEHMLSYSVGYTANV